MSVYPGQKFEFTHNGLAFVAEIHHDDSHGAPWEECDGFFHVDRVSSDYQKRPSEVFLHKGDSREWSYVYDVRAAIAQAVRESWGCKGGMREGETPRQYAARAVRETAEFLRGWCADEWGYVGVKVSRADSEGETVGESSSLWGVESCGDYAETDVCAELADDVISLNRAKRAERKAAKAKLIRRAFPNNALPFAPFWRIEQYAAGRRGGLT